LFTEETDWSKKLAHDHHSLTIDANNAKDRLNDDQRSAYETILNVVTNKENKLFFVYGNGEPAKHLFGQHLCPVYEGKAKSCL
jgi:hypothetical protein